MKQKFSVPIALLILLFSLVVKAQGSSTESPYLTNEPLAATDTSEFNRKNKTISAYYEVTGGTTAGYTINAAYFLRPDLQLMFEYSDFGPQFELFGFVAEAFGNYSQETIDTGYGLHLKYFLGNSIYMRLGGSVRNFSYTRTFKSNGDQSYFDADLYTATIGFGNDWQWENFFFGIEWYKINIPVGMTITQERIAAGDSLKDKEDSVRRGNSWQIGTHVGFSF